jgi:NAD(P)-dependent dehydrogenase (short-subunit alcohol dehydrogenase family)
MDEKKVWLITGAARGLGRDITKAVLAAGHAVAATARDAAKIKAAIGEHDKLLALKLDVTRPENAEAAVERRFKVWPH